MKPVSSSKAIFRYWKYAQTSFYRIQNHAEMSGVLNLLEKVKYLVTRDVTHPKICSIQ